MNLQRLWETRLQLDMDEEATLAQSMKSGMPTVVTLVPSEQQVQQVAQVEMEEDSLSELNAPCGIDMNGVSLVGIRAEMLTRVAMSDAHFKHQQRGEPDLSFEDKMKIANEILEKGPSKFLSRFKQYLTLDDMEYFKDMRGDYEIDFYVGEITKQSDTVHSAKVVKNRRYAAMQELMKQGDYFSEDEMKWRDPLLYEQMVGKYLTEEEIQSKVDKADLRFSNILLKHMDQIQENALYETQKETEECQDEEEESEEEGEEMSGDDDEDQKLKVTEAEKQMLKAEFLQIMQERFIAGNDRDFNYSEVDKNPIYDSLDTLDKDEQEKYFDEEEACSVGGMSTDSPQMVDSPRPVVTSVRDDATDYMKFETEPDVTGTASAFDKMAVEKDSNETEMCDKG